MTWFNRLSCRLGLHRWNYNRKQDVEDVFPYTDDDQVSRRRCRRCGRSQAWQPGWGGTDIGSWLEDTLRTGTSAADGDGAANAGIASLGAGLHGRPAGAGV